jgi:hypothetical protein
MIELKGGARVDWGKVIAYVPSLHGEAKIYLEGGGSFVVNNTIEELDAIREAVRRKREKKAIESARYGPR